MFKIGIEILFGINIDPELPVVSLDGGLAHHLDKVSGDSARLYLHL